MEESEIRSLIRKHSVDYVECSKKGIYVNELYVDEFTEELIYELNQERAMEKVEPSENSLHKHIVNVPLLSDKAINEHAKNWADKFEETGETYHSIALTSYKRGCKRVINILKRNAR